MFTAARSIVLTVLLLSLLALSPAPLLASGWSVIASTCTPDENALLPHPGVTPDRKFSSKYDFHGAVFSFLPRALSEVNRLGEVLPITVRCNVTNPLDVGNPAWNKLIVSYQDPDGVGSGSRVVVRLMRVFRVSGGALIAAFDSNTRAATALADETETFDNDSLDFTNSDYFIEIRLYRTTLASNPSVLRVRLDE